MIVTEIIMIPNDINIDFSDLLSVLNAIILIFITPILVYRVYRPKIVISRGFTVTKRGHLRFKIQNQSKFREVFDVTVYVAFTSKNVANRYFTQSIRIPYLDAKSSKQKETNYTYERIITEQRLPNGSEGKEQSICDFFQVINNGKINNGKELKPCIEITIIVYDKYTSVKHSYSRFYHFEDIVENGVFFDDELEPRSVPINTD